MPWFKFSSDYKPVMHRSLGEPRSPSEQLLRSSLGSEDCDLEPIFGEEKSSYDENFPVASSLRKLPTIAHGFSCLVFLLGVVMIAMSYLKQPSESACIKRLTVWSPLVEVAEMEEVNFVNYLMHYSEFRGPPTPKIEEAWDSITQFGGVNIPISKLPSYNRSEGVTWDRATPEEGGGFLAGIEVFHQLHCLNVVRKFTWLDHYTGIPIGFDNDPVNVRVHVDHCLETIRLALMCNADLTPYFLETDPSIPIGGRNDFNTHHKCKRWDVLVDWMDNNVVNGKLADPSMKHVKPDAGQPKPLHHNVPNL